MPPLFDPILGAWRLVHSISITPEGKTEYPFGNDAIGYIYYSPTGIMAVQISRKLKNEAEASAPIADRYLAYFGRYEVDTDAKIVRHFLEGELSPGHHPSTLERRYHFDGDLMSLKPIDGTNREILWQRTRP